MGTSDETTPRQLDLTDTTAIHQALDDNVIRVVTDVVGYPRDMTVDNVKLGLGSITVAVAALAHFLPGKFETHWWQLFACLAAYVTLNSINSIFCFIKEKHFFLQTYPHPDGRAALKVESRMNRFSQFYQLVIQDGTRTIETDQLDVATMFHEDGYLATEKFTTWIKAALGSKKVKAR